MMAQSEGQQAQQEQELHEDVEGQNAEELPGRL